MLGAHEVSLVHNNQLGHFIGTDFRQYGLNLLDTLVSLGVGSVNNVQQQVRMDDFFQSRLERLDQRVGQGTDEADGIRHHHITGPGYVDFAGGWIQRRKQQVLGKHVSICDGIEQRRFPGIGVAHQGYGRCTRTISSPSILQPATGYVVQLLFRHLDALGQHSLIQLDLFFTRATHPDTAFLSVQVSPATHQARLRMLELSKLNLQLAFVAASALGKDSKNEFRSGDDPGV